MNNPERIYICTSSVPQALKDGVGSYYPNFTGDAAQFDLVAYVPESKVTEEREAAFKEAADYIRRQWLAAYPVEVFAEPPPPPTECSRDVISAAMGRHMATKLIEHFEAAATENRKGEG